MTARRAAIMGVSLLPVLAAAATASDLGFAPAVVLPAGPDPSLIAVQDVTGDGAFDVIVSSGSVARLRVLVNDGLGDFSAGVVTPLEMLPHDWGFGDFDGDGQLDVVTIGGDKVSTIEPLLADGTGHFVSAGSFQSTNFSNGTADVTAADVDEDGLADLLLSDNGRLRVLLGDGSGGFAEQPLAWQGVYFRDAPVADANGDGHVDVVLLEAGFGFDWEVLLGDGHGHFSLAAGKGEGPCDCETNELAVGDLNGDHLSDVAVGYDDYCAFIPSTDMLIGFSNGTSIVGKYPDDATAWLAAPHLQIADMDGDGFGDLVGCGNSSTYTKFFVAPGLGDGTFAPYVSFDSEVPVSGLAVGDLDGDGVPDVVIPGWFESVSVVLNTSLPPGFSVAGPGLPGALGVPVLSGTGALLSGSAVQISLEDGAPGAVAGLVIGLQAASVPFKGGVLVPSLDLLLPGLVLSPTGGLVVAGIWPTGLPAGVTTWWQAWIADASGQQGYAASNALAAKAQAP